MVAISKLVYETLKDKNGNLSHNPVDWWKKNKWACSWCLLCMIVQIPMAILRFALMIICFIPHKIYEYLECMKF